MPPKIVYFIRVTVAALFILFGVYVFFFRNKINLESPNNYIFSLLLIVYGIYRIYRAVKNE